MSFISKLTIGKQLVLLIICLIIFGSISGVVGFYGISDAAKNITLLLKEEIPLSEKISKIDVLTLNLRRYEKDFIINIGNKSKQEEYQKKFNEIVVELRNNATELQQFVQTDEHLSKDSANIKSVETLLTSLTVYETGTQEVFAKIYADDSINAIQANSLLSNVKTATYNIQECVKFLSVLIDKSMTGVEEETLADAKVAIKLIIISIISAVLISIFLGFLIARAIIRPIVKISNDLGDSARQVASASGELSSSSSGLSSAASQQASSIEETSASLEEITGMINNNLESARSCLELAKNMNQDSEKGNLGMTNLIASMKDILKSNESIQALVEMVKAIGDKTKIIDEIVFQTKLLSFNASVEAERAGEHGRGFAVVAQEVGNLAQMSGKAATEIAEIVKNSIHNAEGITTDNKAKVEDGNKLVVVTSQILKEVSLKSSHVAEGIKQILNASEEQARGITQINTAIAQLDKATQDNAATAEEAASTSEELSAQADNLKIMVGELNKMATGK